MKIWRGFHLLGLQDDYHAQPMRAFRQIADMALLGYGTSESHRWRGHTQRASLHSHTRGEAVASRPRDLRSRATKRQA